MIDLDKWKHPSILIIVGYIYHYTFYIPIISTSLEKKNMLPALPSISDA
jgi:hypothetical protein